MERAERGTRNAFQARETAGIIPTEPSWERLLHIIQCRATTLGQRLGLRPVDIEDAVGNAAVRLVKRTGTLPSMPGHRPLARFAATCAYRSIRDQARRLVAASAHVRAATHGPIEEFPAGDDFTAEVAMWIDFREAVAQLPATERRRLTKWRLAPQRPRAIAEVARQDGTSEAAFKKTLARVRRKLSKTDTEKK